MFDNLPDIIRCKFCNTDVARMKYGEHMRTEEHEQHRKEVYAKVHEAVGDSYLCEGCHQLRTEDDGCFCGLGFISQQMDRSWQRDLLGYYKGGRIALCYPNDNYEDGTWDLIAIRPKSCVASTKLQIK